MWTTLFGLVHFARAFMFVDNVDHLFLGCPHCPQTAVCKIHGADFVGHVDNVDHAFLVASRCAYIAT